MLIEQEQIYFRDGRRWSVDEDALLCSTYPVGGIASARDALPHKSVSSIIRRAKRLGIGRSGTGKMKYWTGADEMKLRRLWRNGSKDEIETVLPGRTWRAITSKARKLDLFRNFHVRRPLPETDDPILQAIRHRMQDRGFTATDLQEVAGLKRGVTRNWFSGNAQPKITNIVRAVEALDGELVIKWNKVNN